MSWDSNSLSTGQSQTYGGQSSNPSMGGSRNKNGSETSDKLYDAYGLHAATLGVAKSSERLIDSGAYEKYTHGNDSVGLHVESKTSPLFSGYQISDGVPLGGQQVQLKDLKKDHSLFSQAVKNNTENFKWNAIEPGSYLKRTTMSDYQSVKNLPNTVKYLANSDTTPKIEGIGSSLVKSAGVGFAGFDILSHTSDAYKEAKANGASDGAALAQGANEFGKYTVRDGSTWEAATMGGAIGAALIPISVGCLPLGAVLGGAAASVAAQKGFNSLFNTGDHDPVEQNKKAQKQQKQNNGQ